MLHIVIGSLVIHLEDIACLTESQKLAHLIYLEQLTWILINAGEAPEDSITPMIESPGTLNLIQTRPCTLCTSLWEPLRYILSARRV